MIRTMEVYQGRMTVVTIEIPDDATEEEMEAIAFKAAAASDKWVDVEEERWVRACSITIT
jgi:hypothetical protein